MINGKRPTRREYMALVRPQMKIAALVAIPLILICVLSTVLQTYVMLSTFGKVNMARQIVPVVTSVMAIILLVMVPLCICIAIYVSHRLVGPMRRLAREMDITGAGRMYGPFFFRDGDDLNFLGVALHTMRERLRARLLACRLAQARMEDALRRMETASADSASEELKAAAAELQAGLDQLQTQMAGFELEQPESAESPAPGAQPAEPSQREDRAVR